MLSLNSVSSFGVASFVTQYFALHFSRQTPQGKTAVDLRIRLFGQDNIGDEIQYPCFPHHYRRLLQIFHLYYLLLKIIYNISSNVSPVSEE